MPKDKPCKHEFVGVCPCCTGVYCKHCSVDYDRSIHGPLPDETEFDEYEVGADGWTDWIEPVTEDYKLACCDCGSVHAMDFRTEAGRIEIRFKKDELLTEELRRHMDA